MVNYQWFSIPREVYCKSDSCLDWDERLTNGDLFKKLKAPIVPTLTACNEGGLYCQNDLFLF